MKWEPMSAQYGGIAVPIDEAERDKWAQELLTENMLLDEGTYSFIASGESIVIILPSGEVMDCIVRRRIPGTLYDERRS